MARAIRSQLSGVFVMGRRKKRWLHVAAARGFLRAMIAFVKDGGRLVSYEVAEQRARVCIACPLNVKIPGCSLECSAIRGLTMLAVGRRELLREQKQLHFCKVCRCYNAASVWFPIEAKQKAITPEMNAQLPDHCWQKQLSNEPQPDNRILHQLHGADPAPEGNHDRQPGGGA